MAAIWLVTGAPGVGKSTLISRAILRLKGAGVIVGGCSTIEHREKGVRVGFWIRDLTNGGQGELASITRRLGPKVGKYRLNLDDLSSVGAKGISDATERSELVVIDEIGPMELMSPEFRKAAKASLESGKPILAVVHERIEDDLLSEFRSKAKSILEVTINNREELRESLAQDILSTVGPKWLC